MYFSLYTHRGERPVPAVFLDRDGTINVEKHYLHRREDWEWIPGAQKAIRLLKEAGFFVIVVSNQAGIARGMYGPTEVDALHEFVQKDLATMGAVIDAFFYCPHHPEFGLPCRCRKPAEAMIASAASQLNVNLSASWMVGDKMMDIQAGLAAGVTSLLVKTGYGAIEAKVADHMAGIFDSIIEATQFILERAGAQAASA